MLSGNVEIFPAKMFKHIRNTAYSFVQILLQILPLYTAQLQSYWY